MYNNYDSNRDSKIKIKAIKPQKINNGKREWINKTDLFRVKPEKVNKPSK